MPEISQNSNTTQMGSPSPAPSWFAVYTASHHEKHVQEKLTERRVESFVPLYRMRREWKKRKSVSLELPLFPNYVFVRISRGQRAAVLEIPGVFSLVGSGQQAWELPESEIDALRSGVRLRKLEPHPYLVVGERARVKTGVLAGLEGVIVRTKGNLRIVVTLAQITRSVAIEVGADELEPLSPSLRVN